MSIALERPPMICKREALITYQMIRTYFRKASYLFSILILLSCFIGCVTQKLWHSQQSVTREEIVATSNQIFFSNIIGKAFDNPSLCYHYKIDSSFKPKHNSSKFPIYHEGYLIIDNLDAISSVSKGLQVLLKEPFASKITSLHASLITTKVNDKNYSCIKILIHVKLPFNPNDYADLKNKNQFHYSFTSNAVTSEDASNPGGIGIITLEAPINKCGEPFGAAKLTFLNVLNASSDNYYWKELIKRSDRYKLQLFFVNKFEEDVYDNSTAKRIILTPFAFAADIIIAPIAFITCPIWMPK
jgi:hypothetical protein